MSKKAALNGMDYIGSYLVVFLCPYPEIINLNEQKSRHFPKIKFASKFASIKSI